MSIPVRVDPAIQAHVVRSGFTLAPGHPLNAYDCPVCDEPLNNAPVALVYVGRCPGERWTAAAVAVHDSCTDVSEEVKPEEPKSQEFFMGPRTI